MKSARRNVAGCRQARAPAACSGAFLVLLGLLQVAPVAAQAPSPGGLPPLLRQVSFDPQLNAPVPPDLNFRDEAGRVVRLGDYFAGKPVVLALVYYGCPMLCNQVLQGLASRLRVLSFDAGRQFSVVVVSFNPDETPSMAAAKKREALQRYHRAHTEAGWHFLTAEEASIAALTRAVGFRYTYDPKTKLYAHASGILILTPQGRISRYFYGIEYAPRDMRFGLIEASANKIGSPVDRILLFCYQYDPATGRYGALVMRLVRLGGVLAVLGLVLFILLVRRREQHAPPPSSIGVN
jgi:protein SCO1